jgi:hypothetical protein
MLFEILFMIFMLALRQEKDISRDLRAIVVPLPALLPRH